MRHKQILFHFCEVLCGATLRLRDLHIRKLPYSKPRDHQDAAREWGSGRFGPFHFLLRDDNLHIFLPARIPRVAHSATDTSGTKGIFPLIQINFVRSGRPTFFGEGEAMKSAARKGAGGTIRVNGHVTQLSNSHRPGYPGCVAGVLSDACARCRRSQTCRAQCIRRTSPRRSLVHAMSCYRTAHGGNVQPGAQLRRDRKAARNDGAFAEGFSEDQPPEHAESGYSARTGRRYRELYPQSEDQH
jgi:hypothetical protein